MTTLVGIQRCFKSISVLVFILITSACGGGGKTPNKSSGEVAISISVSSSFSSSKSSSLASIVSSSSKISSSIIVSSSLSSSSISSLQSSSASSHSSSSPSYLMGGAIQGHPLNLTASVSTLAGAAPGADGVGAAARFELPKAMVRVGGDLYIADSVDHIIRKVVIATGVVSTVAGAVRQSGSEDGMGANARFSVPSGITSDGTNLYVTDAGSSNIRKIVMATGEVTTYASPSIEFGSNIIPLGIDSFHPSGITTDGINLYVTDTPSKAVLKIVIATGAVTELPSVRGANYSSSNIDRPNDVATDGNNLYVTDFWNCTISRIVLTTSEVSTFAGSAGLCGGSDGIGESARLNTPQGITTDGTSLYVSEVTSSTVRKIVISTRAVSTLAGSAGESGHIDGIGVAARFSGPFGIATDGSHVYVSDVGSRTLRKIVAATGDVSTLAGNANHQGVDGMGATARFGSLNGATTDGKNIYVVDDNKIRKIVIATGAVTTLAGGPFNGCDDSTGATGLFCGPIGITTDGANLYVTDTYSFTIRKIVIATGIVSVFAGSPGKEGIDDGAADSATFTRPTDITTDGRNLYVVDGGLIRKIVMATGVVSTFSHSVVETDSAPIPLSAFAVTTDGNSLYVIDYNKGMTFKIALATGVSTAIARSPDSVIYDYRNFMTSDGTNLYITDSTNHVVRKVVIATGAVTTLAGWEVLEGSSDGVGTAANFSFPAGITTDGVDVFVVDVGNNTIRKIH